MAERRHEIMEALQKRKVILIVEDDDVNASILVQMISQERDYRVLHATDGVAALKFLRHFKPDLFILDYRLPYMDGIELYDRLRILDVAQTIPVLMISAVLPRQEIAHRKIMSLSKPFDMDKLLQTIDELLATGQ